MRFHVHIFLHTERTALFLNYFKQNIIKGQGITTVLMIQVAGLLLKQYREKFQGGTLTVTWNYLRQSMNSYLAQPNPVTARWESEDHLRNPNFQLDAFRVSILWSI